MDQLDSINETIAWLMQIILLQKFCFYENWVIAIILLRYIDAHAGK